MVEFHLGGQAPPQTPHHYASDDNNDDLKTFIFCGVDKPSQILQ